MAQKDMLEKHLQSFNDVFADIINVLLMSEGGQRVSPKDLQDTKARSIYKSGGEVHEQERDVVKLWKRGKVVFCLIGLENQSTIDRDLPVRVFSYDGGDYRFQIAQRDAALRAARDAEDEARVRKLQREKFYPVVSIVLNYSNTRWRRPKTLLERVKVPKALEPFVNDYRIHVVDVAWLTKKQERMFTSDFRIIVEYFRQMRLKGKYTPSPQVIRYKDAVLKLLTALTGDRRFEEVQSCFREGERITMVSALDEIVAKGIQQEKESVVARMLKAGKLALKEIAEYSGLTLKEVQAIQRSLA